MNNDIEPVPEQSNTESNFYTLTSHALGYVSYLVKPEGVYVKIKEIETFLCSRIIVENRFRDNRSTGWGRLLSFADYDNHEHLFAMSAADLGKDETGIISTLRDYGITVTPLKKHHYLIIDYLLHTEPHCSIKIRSSSATGWQEPGVYLFSDNTLIGESGEQYLLKSQSSIHTITTRGTVEEWKRELAARCSGNSRLIFAISAAFASTLLYHLNLEGGGFHLFGTSSDGKTTTLQVAASVISNPKQYIQPWRATDNGLEGIARQHNHSLLILDEQGEMSPQDLGKVSYFLSNGNGKIRSRVTGEAKPKSEWLLYYLSSGEMTLGERIAEAGKEAKAGQEVRHVDLPASAGAGMGVFENIHDAETPAAFADLLKQLSARYYGTAFRSFIQGFITADSMRDETLESYLQGFLAANLPADACGQVKRVAQKFAVVAAAGMLASAWEITGWEIEEVEVAISRVFQDWLAHRSHTRTHESEQIITRIRGYLQQYGASRFVDAAYTLNSKLQHAKNSQRIPLQLDGFRIIKNEGNEFYIFPSAFDKIIQGMNRSTTTKFLIENSYLVKGSDGRNQSVKRLPGMQQARVYHFTSKIMLDEVVPEVTAVTENNNQSEQVVTDTEEM